MKEHLQQLSEQFVGAQKTISRVQPLLSMYAYPVCAELFVEQGKEPDLKTLKQCEKILIKKAGLFSDFSGTSALVIISLLSMSEDPEAMYDRLKEARDLLRKYFPPVPDSIALAAIILNEEADKSRWEELVQKAADTYDTLKQKHRILTSGGDVLFSLLLARSGKDPQEVIADARACAERLGRQQLDPKIQQSLSRVLALADGTPDEKCARFERLYELLRDRGRKYGKEYQLPMLGLVAMLPQDVEEIAADIVDVDDYLSKQEMYKGIVPKYSKTLRLMHAAMIVAGSGGESRNLYIAMEITMWMLFDVLFI
ncbi:MAG: DUF4003 family protein [Clostridia bacterium]|nr:DUF4003 family protein [Clostridia bacterium]